MLHYKNLQHYDSHYDFFDPKLYGAQKTQRLATMLVGDGHMCCIGMLAGYSSWSQFAQWLH